MPSLRTFDEIRGNCEWVTTVAYWIGTFRRRQIDSEGLLIIGSAMDYQYDVEEQADCFGMPFPEDASWRPFISPIAPIQLALRWSPVPLAIEVLGEPCCEVNETDEDDRTLAVLFWNKSQIADAHLPSEQSVLTDMRRFIGLLGIAIARGREKGRGLVLSAKPGWDYYTVYRISDESRSIMEQHGFLVTDRRP